MPDERGRFVVGTIPDEHVKKLFQDLGIEQGDEIIAPDGFPDGMEQHDGPKVEHRRVRLVHPNVAYLLADSGVLRTPAPGT